MKKIYSLSLALAVALGASAAGRSTAVASLNVNTPSNITLDKSKILLAPKAGVAAKAGATGFESVKDMEGAWELSMYWLLTDQQGNGAGMTADEITLKVTNEATGEVALSGCFPQNFVVKATVNLAAGTFTIPNNQDLGKDSYGDQNYFYFKGIDDEGYTLPGAMDIIASVGEISNGGISFEPYDLWTIGDPNAENLGFWWLSGLNQMAMASDPNEGWTEYTTGTFVDGWAIPAFGLDGVDYPWEVTIQQNETQPTLYRIADPYIASGSPVANYSGQGGIVFDLTDPDFVTVLPGIGAGLYLMDETTNLQCTNLEGYWTAQGADKETILEVLEITPSSYDADSKTATFLNCRWTFAGAEGFYIWNYKDAEGNTVSAAPLMHGSLLFDKAPVSSVENVAVDENNAAVEYFNLQGMRVANPTRGSIVIKRQGDVTSKVRF